jgi:hypothetical protein
MKRLPPMCPSCGSQLEVPVDMPCELKTVSDDISLDDLHAAMTVRSVSGDIDGHSLTHIRVRGLHFGRH